MIITNSLRQSKFEKRKKMFRRNNCNPNQTRSFSLKTFLALIYFLFCKLDLFITIQHRLLTL